MGRKIYIGNIGPDTTDTELQDLFTTIGPVNRVRIAFDSETGERKNFGYVEMATQEAANAAIQQLDGHQHRERELRVREARPSKSP